MHTTSWLLSSSRLLALALWGMVSFQACGGDSEPQNAAPACGPGTALVNGQCVVVTECGEGTVIKAGKCVPEAVAGQGGAAGSQSGSGGSGAGQGGAQTGGNDPQGGQGGAGTAGAGGTEAGAGSGVAGAEAGGAGGAPMAGSAGVGQAGSGGSPAAGSSGMSAGGAGAGGMGGGAGQGTGGASEKPNKIPENCQEAHGFVGCCGPDGNYYYCSVEDPNNKNVKKDNCYSKGCSFVPGWGEYTCGTGLYEDPSGTYPRECGIW